MPRYYYHCQECEESFEMVHSMGDKPSKCSVCGAEGSLQKIPTLFSVESKSTKTSTAKDRVDEFISSAKEELKQHRDDLSKKEYTGE